MITRSHPSKRNHRIFGAIFWSVGMVVGAVLLLVMFLLPPLFSRDPARIFVSYGIAASLAFPAVLVYMWVPVLIDRYEPEPWWALAMVFLWGAVPACAFAGIANDISAELGTALAGKLGGEIAGAVISAPIFEEAFKGLVVLGVFWFARHEFDGVVDGVVYATFAALGFAAVENVLYYARSLQAGGMTGLATIFVFRGIFAPWGHPLYTSMTGLGIGLARESHRPWVKFAAPVTGYVLAVFFHALWNGSALFSSFSGFPLFILLLPLWILFVLAFLALITALVVREGRILRRFLEDEVLLGNITRPELELVCSPFGRMRALLSEHGPHGRRFIDAASRLALSKWHSTRAAQGNKLTVSADFIVPLRQELQRLRQQLRPR